MKNKKPKIRNFVAKHAHIQKAGRHKDKKNDYKRKEKFHKGHHYDGLYSFILSA